MTDLTITAPARLATRLVFFASGFAMAAWAPLIPFAKANVGADEATFGVLLLCVGLGSLVAMPITGVTAARSGARPMILAGGIGMGAVLPLLAFAPSVWALAAALFVFGAALGTLDVSMNVHAAEVEAREARPLMSGFHALFSVGTFAGSALMTAALSLGVGPRLSAGIAAVLCLLAVAVAAGRLLRRAKGSAPEPFAWPRGVVVLLAVLTGIAFLVEGAMLDWGALLLIDRNLATAQSAGVGYMVFSIAMVVARLTGDQTVARLGARAVLIWGGGLTIAGLALVLAAPWAMVALVGFALIGLGAANVVPVLFSAAGRQRVMPPGLAIASVTITGYAGVLLGPALMGFVADASSLPLAFAALAVLVAVIPLAARAATRT
ncbi:MFS transporter [Tropicibacter naphthalenivorans]|uniref:Inner membrane protein YbjJ n=1 Tax=Tropicibacter naphthalenivorans TaxID=441103 RepID=A0A0N7LYG5_9RHOB|nr:MFS transporter [Tropicibacter naphthalenivorans]CUH74801.1 Inner membrane protein YbjJ [Tropicibacter naphthalenivorans]SMC48888.1 Predicted arabinose efflux permease, MFS family [Tropicibacter naphthalenivorans]